MDIAGIAAIADKHAFERAIDALDHLEHIAGVEHRGDHARCLLAHIARRSGDGATGCSEPRAGFGVDVKANAAEARLHQALRDGCADQAQADDANHCGGSVAHDGSVRHSVR